MASEKKKHKAKNNLSDEDDEDDTFYYRYASATPSSSTAAAAGKPSLGGGGGSGTLAPSKSTLYVSNLDYSLTNSDLHTLFSTSGKIARVTVLKDRRTRLSRGVSFVQFVSRGDAAAAAAKFDGKVLNGRILRASIAADNGRAAEFIRKRVYRDKSRCYECGAEGHLSYECPRNRLGPRERPEPKRERRKTWRSRENVNNGDDGNDDDDDDGGGGEACDDDNWASVVDAEADDRLLKSGGGDGGGPEKKRAKKASYFSDESGDEDD